MHRLFVFIVASMCVMLVFLSACDEIAGEPIKALKSKAHLYQSTNSYFCDGSQPKMAERSASGKMKIISIPREDCCEPNGRWKEDVCPKNINVFGDSPPSSEGRRSCTDSDEDDDIFERGRVTVTEPGGSSITRNDWCDGSSVVEMNCDLDTPEGYVKKVIGCEHGCDGGFCLPETECNDGVDNDGDGSIDVPDPGCSSDRDTDEHSNWQCDDGDDNDGDGMTDMDDPDCDNLADNDESAEPAPEDVEEVPEEAPADDPDEPLETLVISNCAATYDDAQLECNADPAGFLDWCVAEGGNFIIADSCSRECEPPLVAGSYTMVHSDSTWEESAEILDDSNIIIGGEDPTVLAGPDILIGASPTDGSGLDPDEYIDPVFDGGGFHPYAVYAPTDYAAVAEESTSSPLVTEEDPGGFMLIPEGPCCVKCVFYELDAPDEGIVIDHGLDDPIIDDPYIPGGFLV